MPRYLRLWILVLALWPTVSAAAPAVIPPGHEDRVVALLSSYVLGGAAIQGWRLQAVKIQARSIEISLVDGAGQRAGLALLPPDGGGHSPSTPSFSTRFEAGHGDGRAALQRLTLAIAGNDDGTFWDSLGAPTRLHEVGASREAVTGVTGVDVLLGLSLYATVVACFLAAMRLCKFMRGRKEASSHGSVGKGYRWPRWPSGGPDRGSLTPPTTDARGGR